MTHSDSIVGKTITGVITKNAGKHSNPALIMLRFSDGSTCEFISHSALKRLQRIQAGLAQDDARIGSTNSRTPSGTDEHSHAGRLAAITPFNRQFMPDSIESDPYLEAGSAPPQLAIAGV